MPNLETIDYTKGSVGIEEAHYYEASPELSVWSWSAAPAGTPNAKATQVHLHIGSPPGNVFVVRFKGPGSLDALIEALRVHREHVFGVR